MFILDSREVWKGYGKVRGTKFPIRENTFQTHGTDVDFHRPKFFSLAFVYAR